PGIAAINLPLSTTVWVSGKTGTIAYRISGSPGGQAYEIDLVTGDPQNAQLVYVFDKQAVSNTTGINTVVVNIPSSIPNGRYGLRLGLPDENVWKYSQIFSIDSRGQSVSDTSDSNARTDTTMFSTSEISESSDDGFSSSDAHKSSQSEHEDVNSSTKTRTHSSGDSLRSDKPVSTAALVIATLAGVFISTFL
ncbi:hypothetical protein IW150_004280, partial [Coemansia sp. RSA 2607]